MIVTIDTSALIELEHKNPLLLELIEQLLVHHAQLLISSITVAEVMTGIFFVSQEKPDVLAAREFLSQFEWIGVDYGIAEEAGRIIASCMKKGIKTDHEDCIIGATAIVTKSDVILTLNKKDFVHQGISAKVLTPKELLARIH